MIVDFDFYTNSYVGDSITETDFPKFAVRAESVIQAVTFFQVTADNISLLPAAVQENYKMAICAQADFLFANGLETLNGSMDGNFRVGNVSVSGSSKDKGTSGMVSPYAMMLLSQYGLNNPSVGVADITYLPVWV